ncbi:hypothetical protein PAHAL_1G130300 [Panicum hallii]|uniref:Uncharacterized protein n=1 Tax=Panicum hallii TaxID=206008 RepID=A0A2T8KV41_9POAL|nr:hypothetical protein PAHAL_1G130300 [Panicum hallii]
MAGSDWSVHGGNHGDEEPHVTRTELRRMANSLLEAMERMFNERLPTAGGRGRRHQHEDNHRPHEHRHGARRDGENHHGHRNRDDPDGSARVKLSVPKFSGREDVDAYLESEKQCDQIFRVHNLSDERRVNLASIEFSGDGVTLGEIWD